MEKLNTLNHETDRYIFIITNKASIKIEFIKLPKNMMKRNKERKKEEKKERKEKKAFISMNVCQQTSK